MEGGAEPLCHSMLQRTRMLHPEERDGDIYPTHHTWVSSLRKNSVYT